MDCPLTQVLGPAYAEHTSLLKFSQWCPKVDATALASSILLVLNQHRLHINANRCALSTFVFARPESPSPECFVLGDLFSY